MSNENRRNNDVSVWDATFAASLIVKRVLIGFTHLEAERASQEQAHGPILSVDSEDGVILRLEGARSGEEFWPPPALAQLNRVQSGHYQLRSTGEVAVDPDYISS